MVQLLGSGGVMVAGSQDRSRPPAGRLSSRRRARPRSGCYKVAEGRLPRRSLTPAVGDPNTMPRKTRRFRYRGLTVIHDPVPGPITAIALEIRAGARFDGRTPGIAHMAEHMMFQGTHDLDQLALNHRAAELGGNHNADTGYETIALTIEVFNQDLDAAFDLVM